MKARQIGTPLQHFGRRTPIRPFALGETVFTPAQVKPGRPTPMP